MHWLSRLVVTTRDFTHFLDIVNELWKIVTFIPGEVTFWLTLGNIISNFIRGCFKKFSKTFHENFQGVTRVLFQGNFMVFGGCLNVLFLTVCFKEAAMG